MTEDEIAWQRLTPEEQQRLNALLALDVDTIERLKIVATQDARMEWLWALLRRTASTAAIIVGAIVLLYDQLRSVVRAMLQ